MADAPFVTVNRNLLDRDICDLARRILSDEEARIVEDLLDAVRYYRGEERAPVISRLRDKWELRRMP